MKKILVIGSLNVDFSISVDKIPLPGETINADKLLISNGGKGANQAYTIGKLGGDVSMLGLVGDDIYGQNLKESLTKTNVDVNGIYTSSEGETGKAFIYVDKNGENCISIIHGTNYLVNSDFIIKHEQLIKDADIILIQLEIPMEAIKTILEIAKDKIILLDPAPATKELISLDLSNIYLMKPNKTELHTLTDLPTDTNEEIVTAAKKLLVKGIKNVVVSLGGKGCLLVNNDTALHFGSIPTKVVDTTAAGDSFIASIALMLSKDYSLNDAIKFATKVASLVVGQKGAQDSIPSINDLI